MVFVLFKALALLLLFRIGDFHKEEECVEVGFARTSHLNVEQSYQLAKETLLPLWEQEDLTLSLKYSGLSPQVKNVSRSALLLEQTTKNILSLIRKTRVGKRCPENWLIKGMEKHVMPLIQLDKDLAESLGLVMSFRCLIGSPYPNVDGTCINEEAPDQGAIGAKFLRLIPPVAAKDAFSFRVSVHEGRPLPSARQVAQLIRKHLIKPPVTALFSEWSYIVASDTISIPESPLVEDIDCCRDSAQNEDCVPIFLDDSDPEASTLKCINFKRSIRAQAIIGHRESLSVVSTYLDINPVYGVTNEEAFSLKEGYFGYLKSPASLDKEPHEKDTSKCKFPLSFEGCFGLAPNDKIFEENLRLLFLLEHNHIADTLAELNPHFDDALLYNEARRINIAKYNCILYGQFLPTLIGKDIVEKQSLHPGAEGPGAHFIPEVNPGILASYALSASRNSAMDTEWRGEREDLVHASQFRSVRKDKYVDLLAMEIQRARDHGLASYGTWRSFCDSGKSVNSWDDLKEIFSDAVIEDLRNLFEDEVADLDISVALLEPVEEGAMLGKIQSCILVDQFARLRTGNRLFWEHESSQLSEEQRESIEGQQSAADLLCRHFGLVKVAENPFLPISHSNPEIVCEDVPKMDLTPWLDSSLIEVMKEKKEEEEELEKKRIEEDAEKKRIEEDAMKKIEDDLKKKEEVELKLKEDEKLKLNLDKIAESKRKQLEKAKLEAELIKKATNEKKQKVLEAKKERAKVNKNEEKKPELEKNEAEEKIRMKTTKKERNKKVEL